MASAQVPHGLPVSVVVTPDPPSRALLQHSPGTATVVIGSRGPLALARLAPDSVSRAVLDAVTVPVLLVPRPTAHGG